MRRANSNTQSHHVPNDKFFLRKVFSNHPSPLYQQSEKENCFYRFDMPQFQLSRICSHIRREESICVRMRPTAAALAWIF